MLDKFISVHSEINNKAINALCKDNKIQLNKTLLENSIKENNLIILEIEEPEVNEEKDFSENEEKEEIISIEYNPENVIWIDENVDNAENSGYRKELNSLGYNVQCFKNVDEGFN